jgi:hypothetical protein
MQYQPKVNDQSEELIGVYCNTCGDHLVFRPGTREIVCYCTRHAICKPSSPCRQPAAIAGRMGR